VHSLLSEPSYLENQTTRGLSFQMHMESHQLMLCTTNRDTPGNNIHYNNDDDKKVQATHTDSMAGNKMLNPTNDRVG